MAPLHNSGVDGRPSEPPLDIRIRSYRSEDYKVVLDMYIAGMHYYCPPGENEGLRMYVQRTLKEDMAEGGIEATYFGSGGHFWVATITEEDGQEKIIGSIAIERKENDHGELRRLSVKDAFRRHGLGRTLIDHMENWAAANGFSVVSLNTGSEMKPAIRLYERLGYVETRRHVFSEEPYAALLWYEKKLPSATP